MTQEDIIKELAISVQYIISENVYYDEWFGIQGTEEAANKIVEHMANQQLLTKIKQQ